MAQATTEAYVEDCYLLAQFATPQAAAVIPNIWANSAPLSGFQKRKLEEDREKVKAAKMTQSLTQFLKHPRLDQKNLHPWVKPPGVLQLKFISGVHPIQPTNVKLTITRNYFSGDEVGGCKRTWLSYDTNGQLFLCSVCICFGMNPESNLVRDQLSTYSGSIFTLPTSTDTRPALSTIPP